MINKAIIGSIFYLIFRGLIVFIEKHFGLEGLNDMSDPLIIIVTVGVMLDSQQFLESRDK